MAKPPRLTVKRVFSEVVTDPAALAAAEERDRNYRKTAAGQIGCWMVVDAPLPLLARYVAELPADARLEFLTELVGRLPAEALRPLAEALAARRGPPTGEGAG
jgi:hypothetical protein